ncbi:galanin receptor 2b-like [Glandiceps talaboti]
MNTSTIDATNVSTSTESPETGNSDVSDVVLRVIYAIVGTLGIVGNFMVCVVFINIKELRKTFTNVFILNQSLIDLVSAIMFVSLKFGPTFDVIPNNLTGDIICKIWMSEYILWGLFISSTFNLSFLSIERYLAVCHPVLHRNKITMTKIKVIAVCAWFIGLIRESYWPTMNFNENGICNVKEWPNSGMQKLVGCVVFLTEYVLPLTIMGFSYGNIILELRRRSKKQTENRPTAQTISASNQMGEQAAVQNPADSSSSRQPKTKDDSMSRARKNVTKTMLIVSVTFVICWSPVSISFFVYNLGGYLDFAGSWYYFMVLLVFCNMCVNPFIYAIKYKQFREGIQKIFKCKKNRVDGADESEMENTRST